MYNYIAGRSTPPVLAIEETFNIRALQPYMGRMFGGAAEVDTIRALLGRSETSGTVLYRGLELAKVLDFMGDTTPKCERYQL